MKHTLILYIIFVVMVIIVACMTSLLITAVKWNNGHCKCGGSWEYQGYVLTGHTYTISTYIYKCNFCGKLLSIDFYRFDK